MVKRYSDEEQVKMGIRCNDFNVPKDHISRFIVEFVDFYYPTLGVGEKAKNGFPPKYMFRLLIYAKMEHIESARVISDMAKYHDIYKYLGNNITPSERTIQRFRDEYGKYFEILLQMTLKKAYDDGLTEFNQCLLSMEQIKHTILNTM